MSYFANRSTLEARNSREAGSVTERQRLRRRLADLNDRLEALERPLREGEDCWMASGELRYAVPEELHSARAVLRAMELAREDLRALSRRGNDRNRAGRQLPGQLSLIGRETGEEQAA